MFSLRLEEHPTPSAQSDADILLGWLLDTLGLVRRRSDALTVMASQRPLHRLLKEHLLAEPAVGRDAAYLADALGISATALHHHLNRLHALRLVSSSGGEAGWKSHHLRTGSLSGAVELLSAEVRATLTLRLRPMANWRTANNPAPEGATEVERLPFRLTVCEPGPRLGDADEMEALLTDFGLCGERPGKSADQLTRLAFERLLTTEHPFSLDEGVNQWSVTRPRLQRTFDRMRAAGMVERVPRLDRLTVILWDAISSQHGRRGVEWLRGRGGFGRLPEKVADRVVRSLEKGDFDSEKCATAFDSVSVEEQMLLLNLLGGRLPHGYRLVGETGEDVANEVLLRAERVLTHLASVAKKLEELL
jgi:DNA-binding MarR family transcriptional regulator